MSGRLPKRDYFAVARECAKEVAGWPEWKKAGFRSALEESTAKPRSVRINITLDDRLLKEIDRQADDSGVSRSAHICACIRAQYEKEGVQ